MWTLAILNWTPVGEEMLTKHSMEPISCHGSYDIIVSELSWFTKTTLDMVWAEFELTGFPRKNQVTCKLPLAFHRFDDVPVSHERETALAVRFNEDSDKSVARSILPSATP